MGASSFFIPGVGTRVALHPTGALLVTLCIVLMYCSYLSDARAVPRSSSRSFRFPTNIDDHDTFKDGSSTLFLAKQTRGNDDSHYYKDRNQGRHAILLTLDSTPIKASVPESPGNPLKNDNDTISLEEISSEIIEDDLSIPVNDELNDDHEKNVHEDEVLREALCSSTDKSVSSTNVSTHLNPHASSLVISSADPQKLRYDLRAGKCAEIGKREHCGENMIFMSDNESATYGFCECDFENKVLRKKVKETALFTRTPLVFHPATNACYRLYEQAYCKEREWLVLSRKEKGPICERNQCSPRAPGKEKKEVSEVRAASHRRRVSKLLTPTIWVDAPTTIPESPEAKSKSLNASVSVAEKENTIWVPLNGSGPCVKLFERNLEHCDEDEQVVFNVGDIVPKCGVVGRGIEGRAIIRNACAPGSYYSIIGRCQPDWDF